ncbi:Cytochrome P450 [Macleaya cordata]|uniref:Cytochrome P450 n=1 Tax=Macleaya cordata TaxID=56857 RepID=A0A200RDP5_MACCD|nr:Cytochrome P450 [Macleaya cordata]
MYQSKKKKSRSTCGDDEEKDEDFVDVLLGIEEEDYTIGVPFSRDNIKALILLRTSNKYHNLPPSPSKLPIIGNLHQLSSPPHHSLHFLSLKHGPLMFLHLGQVPNLIVSSASMAQEIMKTHDLACSSRPNSRIAKRILYDKDVAAAPYGEYWRQVRKICILQLLSPKRVQSYRFVREEEIALMIEKIKQNSCTSSSSSSSSSDLVDLSKTLALLANDIISRVALGKKYRGEDEGGSGYKKMIGEFLALLIVIDIGELIPWLGWVNYFNGLNSRIEKSFKEVDSFLEQVIEDHMYKRKKKKKKMMSENGGDVYEEEKEEDFVDVLLGIEEDCSIGIPFSKDNIKALILDMFSAGTDTTYTVIEWAMAELVRHPEIMKEVQKEVRSITRSGQSKVTEDDIQQMPYLRSVIKETLRLHPPIPLLVPRESTENIKIDGYDIPAKTRIIVNAWAIGRDSESWEEPEKFRPERFLNEGSLIDFKGHDFQLIPFGAGRRGCPGIYLAMATVELALANLLNEFCWEMPNGIRNEDLDMVEGTGLTIHKKTALVLKARPHSKRKLNLPPSPPNKLPILGHLHQLGTLPHVTLRRLAQKHGPLMLLHLGHAPTLVVSSPDAAREITKTHDIVFSSRPHVDFGKTLFYDKDLSLAPYGEYWRQMRKICILHLLSAKRVQSYRSVSEQETAVMMEKISASMGRHVVNLTEILMSFSSDVVCRVALGKKYSGEEVGSKFGEIMVNLAHLLGVFNVADYIPWLAWVNNFNGLNEKAEKTFRELDGFLEVVIEEHIHRKKERVNGGTVGNGDIVEEDLVDVLLGIANDGSTGGVSLGRDSIKAIILDMFAAGTDTSHATLEWAMAELLKHPQIMKEVQKEVRDIARGKPNITEDDLDKMHYLQLVIKETLRFHPPATLLVPRESTEDIKLQGYDIPAKTRLIINAWAIGRDPNSWTEPEKFEPKRFMNSSIDYKGQHFELIPFGAGRRGCPGTLFATSTIELGLANLLYRYDWGLPNGATEDELDMAESGPGIVIHKKSPLLKIRKLNNNNLPPSPPNKLPIIGHLHQLGTILPHKSLQSLAKRHGPDFMLLHLGHAPTIVVSSAKAAKEIMKTHDLVFSSRPPLNFAKKIFYNKDMAFAVYGEYWRQIRKISILHLLSTKRVQSYQLMKEEETAVMIDKISSSASTGRVVNLSEILMWFASDIICRAAFGKKYSGDEVGRKIGEKLMDLIYVMGVFNIADYVPWLAWVNNFNGLKWKMEKTFRELDGFLERVVEEHIHNRSNRKERSNGGSGGGCGEEDDLLDVLCGLEKDGSIGRDNIKAVILDMFAAGTDTSDALLVWAMAELLKHPQIMKKVQKEIREIGRGKPSVTENDLEKMYYLQSVIKETLRLHPPATLLLPRESTEDIKLQGYDIPSKTRVIINAWAIGRDPNSWLDPDKFEPERFTSSSIDYKGQNFEFIPFGAGRRGCPGTLFATSTIELGLANLLYRYDWALPDGVREDELDMAESGPGVVTHKKSPLLLVATHHHFHA